MAGISAQFAAVTERDRVIALRQRNALYRSKKAHSEQDRRRVDNEYWQSKNLAVAALNNQLYSEIAKLRAKLNAEKTKQEALEEQNLTLLEKVSGLNTTVSCLEMALKHKAQKRVSRKRNSEGKFIKNDLSRLNAGQDFK